MAKSYVIMSSKGCDVFFELADVSAGAVEGARALAQRGYVVTAYSCPSLTVSVPYKEGLEDRLAAIWETAAVTGVKHDLWVTLVPGPDSPACEVLLDLKEGYKDAFRKARDEAEYAADVFEGILDDGYSIPEDVYDGLTYWVFGGVGMIELNLVGALRKAARFLKGKDDKEALACERAANDLEATI